MAVYAARLAALQRSQRYMYNALLFIVPSGEAASVSFIKASVDIVKEEDCGSTV